MSHYKAKGIIVRLAILTGAVHILIMQMCIIPSAYGLVQAKSRRTEAAFSLFYP
jgi:hypothetical protein